MDKATLLSYTGMTTADGVRAERAQAARTHDTPKLKTELARVYGSIAGVVSTSPHLPSLMHFQPSRGSRAGGRVALLRRRHPKYDTAGNLGRLLRVPVSREGKLQTLKSCL